MTPLPTAVTRMDHLIQAVLNLSRLGRQELHIEPIVTEALVHETLRTLAHQIAQRQVQTTVGALPRTTFPTSLNPSAGWDGRTSPAKAWA